MSVDFDCTQYKLQKTEKNCKKLHDQNENFFGINFEIVNSNS